MPQIRDTKHLSRLQAPTDFHVARSINDVVPTKQYGAAQFLERSHVTTTPSATDAKRLQLPSACRRPIHAPSKVGSLSAKLGMTIETNPACETMGQRSSLAE